MINKIVAIDFADKRIAAVDYFDDLKEAILAASHNLYSRHKVTLRFPRKTGTGSVVASLEIPDELADTFSVGNHLRGISAYLLKHHKDTYQPFVVGKRLLNYTIVPTYKITKEESDKVLALYRGDALEYAEKLFNEGARQMREAFEMVAKKGEKR